MRIIIIIENEKPLTVFEVRVTDFSSIGKEIDAKTERRRL